MIPIWEIHVTAAGYSVVAQTVTHINITRKIWKVYSINIEKQCTSYECASGMLLKFTEALR